MPTLLAVDERLRRLAPGLAPAYSAAEPFPHIVIDDFLPAEAAEEVYAGFASFDRDVWRRSEHPNSVKLACNKLEQMPEPIQRTLSFFNSAELLESVGAITGIAGLVPDPRLEGGGMHMIKRGGFLKIHADFNYHRRLQMDRRLNLLLYMNKEWKDEYAGHLELWSRDMTHCVQRIAPLFNRCVIFSTTDYSYHGHPDPLVCPPEMTRKSLAVYYYTPGRPAEERSSSNSTLYKARPQDPDARSQRLGELRWFVRRIALRLRGR
jgi:Rps23 Pro-64 3,4-dihydroxylase Tpa1-like proline 4-hydroxylase